MEKQGKFVKLFSDPIFVVPNLVSENIVSSVYSAIFVHRS